MSHHLLALVSFVLLLILLPHPSSALTLQVEPKTEECFHQFVEQGKDVTILYSVTRGGLLDVDVRVCSFVAHFLGFIVCCFDFYIIIYSIRVIVLLVHRPTNHTDDNNNKIIISCFYYCLLCYNVLITHILVHQY